VVPVPHNYSQFTHAIEHSPLLSHTVLCSSVKVSKNHCNKILDHRQCLEIDPVNEGQFCSWRATRYTYTCHKWIWECHQSLCSPAFLPTYRGPAIFTSPFLSSHVPPQVARLAKQHCPGDQRPLAGDDFLGAQAKKAHPKVPFPGEK
jgi:hypothetical protein